MSLEINRQGNDSAPIANQQKAAGKNPDPVSAWDAYSKRDAIAKQYIQKTGESPYAINSQNTPDKQYDYVNNNVNDKSPVAQIYSVSVEANYKDTPTGKKDFQRIAVGQQQIKGNDVPIGNTLIAYLTNNNAQATAKIGNTTPEKLADNFFQSADNIQKADSPEAKRSEDKSQVLAKSADGNGKPKFIEAIDKDIKPGDGILNKYELKVTQMAYVLDAETLTAADKLNKVSGDSSARTTSASTVKMDKDDPYNAFMEKIDKDHKGVTKEKLTAGIEAISDKTKDGGLLFSKAKLNQFLQQ